MSAWTKNYDRIFGRTLRRFEQTRPDGTFMQVSQVPVSGPVDAPPTWQVLVTSESGCCEYLVDAEQVDYQEALAEAERVDLYADASASDYDDCPNCKH